MGEQMTVEKAMELVNKSKDAFNKLAHVDDRGCVIIDENTAFSIRECLLKFQQILLDASVVIP